MKDLIKNILNKSHSSMEELIECVEKVRENGDVVVIKLDGERSKQQYTVFITSPATKKEMIRADESTLKEALLKVLHEYLK